MSTSKFRSGVLHGEEVTELLNYANEHDFALPAVNVIGTNSVNAALETAKAVNSPIIIQYSRFYILITAQKNCCHGSMACWMQVKDILRRTELLYIHHICWTCQRNRCMKI